MTQYKDFQDIEIPDFLTVGFKDTSWGNDTTASSELEVTDVYTIRVWVYNDLPELREIPDAKKYCVEMLAARPDGEIRGHRGMMLDTVVSFDTDDANVAREIISEMIDDPEGAEYLQY